ncbi:hypothetical protein EfmAA290_26420 [Enterococcus faecium]|nr:hypothetical protein EfmAA290_26420 [Enterococcus faecium]
MISEPISTASYVINSIQSAMAAIDRIFEILDETDEIPDLPDARLLEQPKGKIAFKNVQFGYTSDKILMNQVDFSVKPKQTKRNHTLVLSLYRFFRWTKNAIISHCFKGGIV